MNRVTYLFFDAMIFTSRRLVAFFASLGSVATLSSNASAQSGPDLLLGTFGEGHNAVVSADAFLFNGGSTDNRSGDGNSDHAKLDVFNAEGRYKLDLSYLVPDLNRLQPRAGFEVTHIATNSNDPNLPDQMTDVSVGLGVGIAKTEKYVAGLSVGVGYSSATVFGDGNGYYGKADLAFAYNINDTDRVGVVIDYNGNRTFLPDVPLPGFIYTHKYNDQITYEVGFPYSDIQYKPSERVTLLFKYLFPDGGEANVDYAIVPQFHVYAGFQQQTAAFHWNAPDHGDDRILFSQNRAEVGLRGEYGALDQTGVNASFLLAIGYGFKTKFEYGADSRDTDRLSYLADEPYVRIGVDVKF